MKYKTDNRILRQLIAGPFVWILLPLLLILDLFVEIYHRICFPLLGIPLVKRSNYIKIDRHKLSYLNFLDKILCVYCGYANGLTAYFVEIAGDTEHYWCGIKHKKSTNFKEPKHHKKFLEYGDDKRYKKLIGKI